MYGNFMTFLMEYNVFYNFLYFLCNGKNEFQVRILLSILLNAILDSVIVGVCMLFSVMIIFVTILNGSTYRWTNF